MFATKKQPVIFSFSFWTTCSIILRYQDKPYLEFDLFFSKNDFIILDFMFCLICLIHSVVFFSYYFKHRDSCLY